MSACSFPKHEKLKSLKLIRALFATGQAVKSYPIKLVFLPLPAQTSWQVGVSVSKRQFKKAVDRNFIKRLLREAYRLNKHQIKEVCKHPYAMMIIYQAEDKPNFEAVNQTTKQIFQKFLAKINTTA